MPLKVKLEDNRGSCFDWGEGQRPWSIEECLRY